MARIRHSLSFPKTNLADSTFGVQSALFSPASQDTIHALFAPRLYTPGYEYPLIVWLHGQGSDERQLRLIMPLVSMQNFVAVAPRGVCIKVKKNKKEVYGWPYSYEQLPQIEQNIFDAIDAASRKYHISPRKIFLAGFDCGGTMAFRVALSHPQHFAGILSICGAFPNCRTPFANLSLARKLPIFLSVGRDSTQYPANEVCENLRLLHAAGMTVTLRQYPCGHELASLMLADVNRWIMEQIAPGNSQQIASSQSPCEAE